MRRVGQVRQVGVRAAQAIMGRVGQVRQVRQVGQVRWGDIIGKLTNYLDCLHIFSFLNKSSQHPMLFVANLLFLQSQT